MSNLITYRTTANRVVDARRQLSTILYAVVKSFVQTGDKFVLEIEYYYLDQQGEKQKLEIVRKSFNYNGVNSLYNSVTFTETEYAEMNKELIEKGFPNVLVNDGAYGIDNVSDLELVED